MCIDSGHWIGKGKMMDQTWEDKEQKNWAKGEENRWELLPMRRKVSSAEIPLPELPNKELSYRSFLFTG